MIQKRSNAKHTDGQQVGVGEALVLQAAGNPGLYHFSAEVVGAHRHMITRLMRDQGMAGRLSMVSALRGEGVTYSSLAMATTLSHDFSQRVCYVDLNWWWPSPQMAAVSKQSPGIAGIVSQGSTLEDALVKTQFPNLCLLPAGQLPPEQRHVAARSDSLQQVLIQLNDAFDVLVLDIPAVLATSDALALAAQGDICLVVIQQGSSAMASVKQALDDIACLPVKGVVLNRVRVATPAWVRNWMPGL